MKLLAGGALGVALGGQAAGAATGTGGPAPLPGAPGAAEVPDGDLTLLVRATLIDGTGFPPQPDTAILLGGDRILAVGSAAEIPQRAGVRVVDLRGRHVIPGLWDGHTHGGWLWETFLPMHVAHGVTGIREMVGPPGMQEIRDAVEAGEMVGPRMVLTGPLVDGPHSVWGGGETGVGVIEVRTETEAREAVRVIREGGAEFVKVYSFLSQEVYAAVAAACRRHRIPFGGHVPSQVSAFDAVRAGQHTLEHQHGVFVASSRRRDAHLRRLREVFADEDRHEEWGELMSEVEREAFAAHDPARARRLFRAMAAQRTWASPTLGVVRLGGVPPQELLDDARLQDALDRFVHPALRTQWREEVAGWLDIPEEVVEQNRVRAAALAAMVPDMHAAGVPVIAGTDCWITMMVPGLALHDELGHLVGTGLTPMQALQAATRDAAECVGWGDRSGTVEPGKVADLVVLDGDPLEDIGRVRNVHSVVSRGRYLSPRDRSRMLAAVEEAAQRDPEQGG